MTTQCIAACHCAECQRRAGPHLGTPQRTVWAQHQHDWLTFPDSIPEFDTQPG